MSGCCILMDCIAQTGILPAESNSCVVVLLHGCWILMDPVLYSPDRDTLHGCPNSSYVQQLGGSVTAWVLDFDGLITV